MRKFPQELVDHIIDNFNLPKDYRNLSSCSLVSKRWLPRSRSHIFSDVALKSSDHLRSFLNRIHSCPSILSLIKDLWLDFHHAPFLEGDLPQLRHCTNLVRLTIAPIEPRSLVELLNSQPVHCLSMPSIINILSYLPSLETFRIGKWPNCTIIPVNIRRVRVIPSTLPSPFSFPSRLDAMKIAVTASAAFFDWLLSLPVVPKMRSLTVDIWIEQLDGPELVYLAYTGGKLEHLQLRVRWLTSPPIATDGFIRRVLGSSTNLRSLVLFVERSD
ncbi:hypothetical protein C8R43DRAFT_1067344 [Mycena crocata]|nr:hypothetical protein C8R43DRAFT_1067344 [Mycena crocata]